MSRPKVIAANITNLTDARYFAAWEVDYILFDLDSLQIDQVKEICDWISGPQVLLLISGDSLTSTEEAILKIEPAAIASKNDVVKNELNYLSGHIDFFEYKAQEGNISIRLNDEWYNLCQDLDDLKNNTSDGIIIYGNYEEATGIKSFEDLDELFNFLDS